VARIGGDEFVALLREVTEPEVEQVARRILSEVSQPICLDGQAQELPLSLGISLSPRHGSDPDALLRAADRALSQAKAAGRNRHVVFQERPEADPPHSVPFSGNAN